MFSRDANEMFHLNRTSVDREVIDVTSNYYSKEVYNEVSWRRKGDVRNWIPNQLRGAVTKRIKPHSFRFSYYAKDINQIQSTKCKESDPSGIPCAKLEDDSRTEIESHLAASASIPYQRNINDEINNVQQPYSKSARALSKAESKQLDEEDFQKYFEAIVGETSMPSTVSVQATSSYTVLEIPLTIFLFLSDSESLHKQADHLHQHWKQNRYHQLAQYHPLARHLRRAPTQQHRRRRLPLGVPVFK